MKNCFVLALTLGLLTTSTTFAFSEARSDGFRDATTRNGKIDSAEKLDKAIQLRQRNYMMEKIRSNARKNIKNQWLRHTLSNAEAGVSTVSTMMDRTGELEDTSNTRPFTYSRTDVPNNAKRNFRTRAYDYYIEGGDAGVEALESDVVLSSQHEVPTRTKFYSKNKAGAADIIAALRAMQKQRKSTEQVGAGEQKTTFRTGDSQRNFLHPYMKFSTEQ